MSSRDEEFGYLKGQVESLEEQVRELDAEQRIILQEIKDIDKQMALYRHLFMFLRTTIWIGVAIITLKFGDIPAIWNGEK